MKNSIRILLIDDHQVVRDGLQHMLQQEEDMEVVGQGASSQEALAQVEVLCPDIVLMDIKMPGGDGIEITRQLLEKQPSCKVIMLTLYDEYLAQAIDAGATGYLLKDIKRAELARAIRQVHEGQVVISESIVPRPEIERKDSGEPAGAEASDYGDPNMLDEVQMVIPPPVNANQLMKFVSRVEEMLQSRTLQMVGTWQGGTAITIPLPKPAPVENILSQLEQMPEVETIGEKPPVDNIDPKLLKKAQTLSRKFQNTARKTFFITLCS
jgi:DNA-binding NarL/FixJ family response regulator